MILDNINATTSPPRQTVTCSLREIYIATLDTSTPYFLNAGLNSLLALVTTFANLVVLLAIRHVTSIRLPSKLLLCSLVLTDLGTGVVVQPQFVLFLFVRGTRPNPALCPLYFSWSFSGSVFTCASFWALMVISLDRYAALFFHHRYRHLVTTRRVCAVLAIVWSFSLFYASVSLWSLSAWLSLSMICVGVAFPIMSFVFIKIYRRLRNLQIQPQAPDQTETQAKNTLNMERCRRTASAMICVYTLFVICYVPYVCSIIVAASKSTATRRCFQEFSYTLVFLSSLLNPFIYCLRLPEMRTEVVKQLRKLFCQRSC